MKKPISVVITDLDDTLWDWVGMWYRAFKAMLDKLVEASGVPRDQLLGDFKKVYTHHGTSEYAFALQELPSLQRKHPGQDIPGIYAEAIQAYRTARHDGLKLYPDVMDTLESIKDKGTLIIGYTEALAFYTRYRLLTLGLDRTLDLLYSPPDHDLPKGLTPEAFRKYSPEHYRLRRTVHRQTPDGSEKPCAEVLLKILSDIGAKPEEAIYIGDKLVKDVGMAQAAGVTDVHAAYGEAHNREEYDLLRSVTHWTDSAVRREKETTIEPTCVLSRSIAELHDHFTFVPFVDHTPERLRHVIAAWGKSIDVQQHFNELEMKIRNYVITVVVAVFGAAGIAMKENLPVLASLILVFGVVGVLLFWMMDALWYHRLLKGAVDHATFIEHRLSKHLPELGLSESIGKASPIKIGHYELHSTQKLHVFYALLVILLIVAAIVLAWVSRRSYSANLEQPTAIVSEPLPSSQDGPDPSLARRPAGASDTTMQVPSSQPSAPCPVNAASQ